MADTQRSVSAINTLLANNTTQQISPQDLRDAFLSWRMGHGQIYVDANSSPVGSASITVSSQNNWVECTEATWTATSGLHWFDMTSNGRLYYTGAADVTCHIACTVTISGSNNNTLALKIGKNTTPDDASEVQRKMGTGGDVGSTAMHLVTTLSNGNYISLWGANYTNGNAFTLVCANLQVVTMPA